MWEWAFEWGHWWWSVGIYPIDKPTVLCCSHWIWGWFHLFPHIFVWGSCFWFCIPGSSPPLRLPASSSRLRHFVNKHTSSFTHNFVTHHLTHILSHTTLSHIIFHTQLCHTQLCLRCHTPSVTHHLSHIISHIFFHTQLCHTSSFTHNFVIHNFVSAVTHHLSHTQFCHTSSHTSSFTHTTLSHIIFHKQLCHTSYVTHHLSHIISHIFFHTQLCGRRGTWRHPPSFCVAGVALVALGWLCWRAWTGLVAGDAAAFCLAGAHLATSTLVLRGRRGTWWQYNCVLLGRRATYSTRPALVARLDRISRRWRRGTLRGGRGAWRHLLWFCVAGVALGHIHLRFAWQAWHLWHWTGSGGALGPVLVAGDAGALCVAGVALGDIHLRFAFFHTHHLLHTIFGPQLLHTIFETQLCHTPCLNHHLSHTMFDTPSFTHHVWHTLFHTPSFTHHLVTHHLSHTTLSHTIFHHTILHTPLCHTPSFTTPSFTHNFVAHHLSPHHLSHTTLSHTIFRHTIFHTPLCHIPSFTHNFVTRSLSHTTFTHTIFHTQLCRTHTHTHTIFLCPHHLSHTALSHTTLFYFWILHHLLCLSFPVPATTFGAHYWKKLRCGVIRSFNCGVKGVFFLSPKRWQTTQTHWWINMCVYIIHSCIQTLLMNATILLVISGNPTSSDFPGYSKTHIYIISYIHSISYTYTYIIYHIYIYIYHTYIIYHIYIYNIYIYIYKYYISLI